MVKKIPKVCSGLEAMSTRKSMNIESINWTLHLACKTGSNAIKLTTHKLFIRFENICAILYRHTLIRESRVSAHILAMYIIALVFQYYAHCTHMAFKVGFLSNEVYYENCVIIICSSYSACTRACDDTQPQSYLLALQYNNALIWWRRCWRNSWPQFSKTKRVLHAQNHAYYARSTNPIQFHTMFRFLLRT